MSVRGFKWKSDVQEMGMARKVFFSFHYNADNWRASQVRSMGALEGNEPCSDNDWESVTKGGDPAIEKWIAEQLTGRTCAVVLVGAETAGRRWITHEIKEAWNNNLGVVGIRIHYLLDRNSKTSLPGNNPFDELHFIKQPSKKLSTVALLHNPPYVESKKVYAYISDNLSSWIEDAIKLRENFKLS
jgi:hypothetical protein